MTASCGGSDAARRIFLLLVFLTLSVFLAAGCVFLRGPRDHAAAVQALTVEVLEGGLPQSREGIVRRLGPPERSHRKTVQNRHAEDRQDTVYRLVYPGLKVWLYHAAYNDRQFLTRVELGPDGPAPAGPLRLGQSPARVRWLLGEPLERSGDRLSYGRPPNWVHLDFRRGRLQGVTWDFYVD